MHRLHSIPKAPPYVHNVPMKYRVKAHYIASTLPEFFRRLTDGSIAAQKPDGQEIVASMRRAKVTAPGVVEWAETCYCSPPLKHERETVYDHYFSDITTEPAFGGEE